MYSYNIKKSFTLVELMIVIAILAILSAIVIFTLNPSRLFDNFRDTRRVNDILTINKAIIFMEGWNTNGINYGNSMTVYISLPDSSITCSSYTLPALATGYSYSCQPLNTYRNTDGNGWLPIDFTVSNNNRYLNILPIDPTNDATYFYSYFPGGSYELIARMKNSNTNSLNDNGFYDDAFESGSPNRVNFTPVPRNLILNGSMETTVGWTGTSSLSTDAYEGQYSFKKDGPGNIYQLKCFKIDRTKRYKLSMYLKSVGAGGLSKILVGSQAYDKKNREIECMMTTYLTGTNTTLAQTLTTGDTVVYLTSVANWVTATPYIGIYPFEDYPDYTYTRNIYTFSSINTGNNSIALSSAYTGATMPAGTKVAKMKGSDSCTYNYVIAADSTPIPSAWTYYSREVGGQSNNYQHRYGTVCLNLMIITNFTQDSTYSTLIDNIKFELISNQ